MNVRTDARPTFLERTWYGKPPPWVWLLAPVLRGVSWGFRAAAWVRNRRFDRAPARAFRPAARVISVGNLSVGGAGKTPVVIALAQQLVDRGKRVAVLSRGYGGRASESLVSDGSTTFQSARSCGDEPVLIAHRAPGAVVLVGADRCRLAREAVERHGAQVLLLDDGFSHRRLARDEDILVLGGDAPFGNGRLLPAGPLREPVDSARRATLAWLNGEPPAPLPSAIPARQICSRYQVVGAVDVSLQPAADLAALRGERVLLLAGLARPQGFWRTASALGLQVVGCAAFGDHHPYTQSELGHLDQQALQLGAARIVTTEKDAVRLRALAPTRTPVCALRIEVQITAGADVLEGLLRAC